VITPFRIGTRPSRLAVTQARAVLEVLRAKWPFLMFDLVPIATDGDERRGSAREESEDFKRAFTGKVEDALVEGRIEAAVHSLKDLPAEGRPGLALGAVPPREVPNDALVAREGQRLSELGEHALVGTGSLRRTALLREARPGVSVQPVEGNVDTRLRKLDAGEFDAIVVAAAGLRRMGLQSRITELLATDTFVPAIGQGALAVQVRADDSFSRDIVRAADDAASRSAVAAETALARSLGLGCHVPAGALAQVRGAAMRMAAMVATADGRRVVRVSVEGPADDPEGLGRLAARQLMASEAGAILERGAWN